MTALLIDTFAPFLPWLLAGMAALAGVWGYGKTKERKGAAQARADRAAADAKDYRDTTERVTNEAPSDDPADDIRKRMRDRAGKP